MKMKKKEKLLTAFFCVCAFLSSTLLFAGSWKVAEALLFELTKVGLWYFLGLPACCIVLAVCALKLFACYGRGKKDAPFLCQLGFLILVVLMSVSTLPLFIAKEFHEYALMRQGLEASAAPGWAFINCTEDADAEGIDVRTDRYTYFTLATSDWRVVAENATIVKHVGRTSKKGNYPDGQVWGVAPIEYVGPVDGCRTKYPLFAVCADPWFNRANCGWANLNHGYGSVTYIRLLSAQVKFSHRDKEAFWDKWVWNPYDPSQKVKLHHENLFEYDSESYNDADQRVTEKEEEYATCVMAYALAWFGVTVPILLCVCLRLPDAAVTHTNTAIENGEDAWSTWSEPPVVPTPPFATPEPSPLSPPPSTPEAPHLSVAPHAEQTPPAVAGGHGDLPSEQCRGDGRDRPSLHHTKTGESESAVNPLGVLPLRRAPRATVDFGPPSDDTARSR